MPKRPAILPPTLAPRGLSRTEVAAYIEVSPTLFDHLVRDRRMPPKVLAASGMKLLSRDEGGPERGEARGGEK
jgi:hypothetical protein